MAHYIAGQGATQDRGTKVVLQNPDDTLDVKVLKAYDSNGLAIKNSSGTVALTVAETDGDIYVAQNLGVGTTDPSRALQVVSAENELVRLDNTQEGGDCTVNYRTSHGTDVNWSAGVKGSDDSFRIANHTNVGTNDRLTIDSAGKIGVGVADPDHALEVLATSEQLKISYDSDSFATVTVDTNSNLFLNPESDGYIKLDADVRIKEDGFIGTDSGTVLVKFDGDDKKLIAGTSDNRTTLEVTGGLISRVREITAAAGTVSADDFIITCDTSSNAIGLTLPAATVVGKTYQFKDLGNAGTAGREITITAAGSDTIDGDATLVIGSDYANAVLINTASGKWSVC